MAARPLVLPPKALAFEPLKIDGVILPRCSRELLAEALSSMKLNYFGMEIVLKLFFTIWRSQSN